MRVTPLVRTKVEDDIVTIGIMSGTSLDGADAVAVRFRSDATGTDRMTTLGRAGVPMPPELHDALLSLALGNAPDEIAWVMRPFRLRSFTPKPLNGF